jgi:hypothetical protein
VNLEGTYELEQDPLDKTKYSIEFGDAELCSDARTEGILVDDHETGSCIGTSPDPQVYIPDRQKEVYVSGITVVLECVNNRMQIASMAFTFCECSRVYDRFAMPPAWGSWTCKYLNEYPGTGSQPNNLICELGDQLATVLPCTEDRMEREIVWPTISAASCDISFTCGTPVTGKLSATLQC